MHPSIDYPKSTELSEQARHYVRALIKIYGILPFEYPQEVKKGEVDESLVIGSVDAEKRPRNERHVARLRSSLKRRKNLKNTMRYLISKTRTPRQPSWPSRPSRQG
jgi:hypothetical protein